MRNWNQVQVQMMDEPISCFYSTYEELKLTPLRLQRSFLRRFLQYLWGIETRKPIMQRLKERKFLQYLWGIETASKIFCRWLSFYVFTVPMRNWNWIRIYRRNTPWRVFTVPMRNWNHTKQSDKPACLRVFTVPMRNWNYQRMERIIRY